MSEGNGNGKSNGVQKPRLSTPQMFVVNDKIRDLNLNTETLTLDQIHSAVQTKLEFPTTRTNIKHVLKCSGLKYRKISERRRKIPKQLPRDHQSRQVVLAKGIREIADFLGELGFKQSEDVSSRLKIIIHRGRLPEDDDFTNGGDEPASPAN